MKTTLIASVSANGQVLLANNPNHQAPQEIIGFLLQRAGQAGNIVLGRSTYELFKDVLKDFLSSLEVVVLSHDTQVSRGHKTVSSPEEAIQYLEGMGFEEVVVGGGTQTYNAFLDRDFVTDLYLNIVPLVIGDGGILLSKDSYVKFAELTSVPVMDNLVRLHLSK